MIHLTHVHAKFTPRLNGHMNKFIIIARIRRRMTRRTSSIAGIEPATLRSKCRFVAALASDSSGLRCSGFSAPWYSGWLVGRAWRGCGHSSCRGLFRLIKLKSIQTAPAHGLAYSTALPVPGSPPVPWFCLLGLSLHCRASFHSGIDVFKIIGWLISQQIAEKLYH